MEEIIIYQNEELYYRMIPGDIDSYTTFERVTALVKDCRVIGVKFEKAYDSEELIECKPDEIMCQENAKKIICEKLKNLMIQLIILKKTSNERT